MALFGKGLYTGRKYDKIFNIVRSEEAAQALIAEARSNLKDAQDAFANLDPDDPTAMQQLFADLFAAQNALTEAQIKGKTATVKYDTLKKKSQTLAVTQVIKFTKQIKDKKTYILSSVKKGEKSFKTYFKINKTTGKLTVKKGLKKGTCKVAVKVKAAGNSNYKASGYKTVTSTVKVK